MQRMSNLLGLRLVLDRFFFEIYSRFLNLPPTNYFSHKLCSTTKILYSIAIKDNKLYI